MHFGVRKKTRWLSTYKVIHMLFTYKIYNFNKHKQADASQGLIDSLHNTYVFSVSRYPFGVYVYINKRFRGIAQLFTWCYISYCSGNGRLWNQNQESRIKTFIDKHFQFTSVSNNIATYLDTLHMIKIIQKSLSIIVPLCL